MKPHAEEWWSVPAQGGRSRAWSAGAEARRLHLPGGSAPREMARPRGEQLRGGIWVGGTPGYLGSQVRDLRPQGCLSHVLCLQSPALDPGPSSATPVGAIPSISRPKTEMQTPFSLRVPSPTPMPNLSSILIRSDSDLPLQVHPLLSSQPLLFVTKTKWMFTLGLLLPLFWVLLPLGLLLLGFKLKCHSVGGASLTPGPLQTIVLYCISWFSPKSPFVHLYLKSPCLLSFVLTVALSREWASP